MAKKKIARSKLSKPKKNANQRAVSKTPSKKMLKSKQAPKVAKPLPVEEVEEDESDHGEDFLGMVENDDLEFLKQAITNRSYSLFNRIRYSEPSQKPRKKKSKPDNNVDETLENDYEDQFEEPVPLKALLPIKTKDGLVQRTAIAEEKDEDEDKENETGAEINEETQEEEDDEDGEFILEDPTLDLSKPVTAAQLLAARSEALQKARVHIGTLSAGLLESPEEKMTNLRTLLQLLDEDAPEAYVTIRKLVIVSMLEVFKDLLPSYQIRVQDTTGIKLKKETLKLTKFEQGLLLYYKKYLQKLEKFAGLLRKKMGDTRVRSKSDIDIAEVAVHAMCDLLVAHPYFNFSQNIAQAIVPFMNNRNRNVRQLVAAAVKTVFKEDKKEEITLKIMRIINHYLKNHAHNVNPDMLEVLLALRIKDVNLDQEVAQELKQKKLDKHKANVLSWSKKEKKRKKKLQDLEKELLETKAEENKKTKMQNLTEITKVLFGIYFRILKSSNNTRVLGICLEGLSKYAHCINLEYYVDIVRVLDKLLKEEWLGYRENLHCIQTVFSILSGSGEALNLDPSRFYTNLYKDLLTTTASKNHANFIILLHAVISAIIKRRKRITNKRIIGFIKRLATLSLQLLHNSSLSCLAVIKTVMQLGNAADILLDLDDSVGDGEFNPELEDPEYSGASSTALYELALLHKHYHPIVSKYARHIASGVPATGEGSLPPQFGKCTPEQLYADYDMSQMAFNPAIPVPRKAQGKSRPTRHNFMNVRFRDMCYEKAKLCSKKKETFYINY